MLFRSGSGSQAFTTESFPNPQTYNHREIFKDDRIFYLNPINSYKYVKIESFRRNIDLHLNTYIWIAKIIADKMIKNKSGSIIQLSSIYGNLGQDPTSYEGTKMRESMTYTAIKGGIINYVKSMAAYYGKYNIRTTTKV